MAVAAGVCAALAACSLAHQPAKRIKLTVMLWQLGLIGLTTEQLQRLACMLATLFGPVHSQIMTVANHSSRPELPSSASWHTAVCCVSGVELVGACGDELACLNCRTLAVDQEPLRACCIHVLSEHAGGPECFRKQT